MEWEKELIVALTSAVSREKGPTGILFSGGTDSSLLSLLAKVVNSNVMLYSSCTVDSHDSKWVPKAAEFLGLPLKIIKKGDEDVIDGIARIKEVTGEDSPLVLLIELPLYFVSLAAEEPTLLSGQGADELFFGYKKYESADTSTEDLRKVMEEILPIERKIASMHGKRIIYPYLDGDVIDLAHKIPKDLKIKDGIRKYVLRSAASGVGLNGEIAWRAKKAAQYSSGFKDAVSRTARKRNMKVHELIREL